MKNSAILLAAILIFSGPLSAAEPVNASASKELTAEQIAQIKELVKGDLANWVALDSKDFVAKNEAGERVTSVRALIHTKKALEDFKKNIKAKFDEATAKVVYEIEQSSVIILQCDEKVASLRTITPANGRLPALGDAKMLNPIQVEVLVGEFCK